MFNGGLILLLTIFFAISKNGYLGVIDNLKMVLHNNPSLHNYDSLFQVLAFFCIVCSAPAHSDSQHWFLTVVVISFLGTIFFSLYYLCLAEPLNKLQINWLMVVSEICFKRFFCTFHLFSKYLKHLQEFWFTSAATFFYFTAFVTLLSAWVGHEWPEWQYWVDALIAAGVSSLIQNGD